MKPINILPPRPETKSLPPQIQILLPPHLEDEALVKQSQSGDKVAFEELVKRYEKKIYNLIVRMLNNEEESSDVLQETFLQVYKMISKFRGKSQFSTWLYRIAVNNSLMRLRKHKHQTVSLDEPVKDNDDEEMPRQISDWSGNPERSSENLEIKQIVTNSLDKLPDDYRSVLVLRDVEGLSNKEVGKILNLSLSAVKSRLHRARMFLREDLSKYFVEGD